MLLESKKKKLGVTMHFSEIIISRNFNNLRDFRIGSECERGIRCAYGNVSMVACTIFVFEDAKT